MKKLVIFDMDQTLVELFDIHNKATKESFKKVLKLDVDLNEVECFGKLMQENAYNLCKKHNLDDEACNAAIPKIIRIYKKSFFKAMPKNMSKALLPGVKKLLQSVKKKKHILCVVTGTIEDIATEILKKAGILDRFDFIVCGTSYATREKLVKKAVDKASRMAGKRFRGKEIIVFGDSPKDIEAAIPYKAVTVIAMTGYYKKKEIQAHKPTHIVKDLSDTAKIMKIIDK